MSGAWERLGAPGSWGLRASQGSSTHRDFMLQNILPLTAGILKIVRFHVNFRCSFFASFFVLGKPGNAGLTFLCDRK